MMKRCGFESWESIWGIWNQMNLRDAEATRRFATIQRFILFSLFPLKMAILIVLIF